MSEEDGKEVKERPMLYNGEMVRAYLRGLKTNTRRPIVPQPEIFNSSTPGMDDCWYYEWKGKQGDSEKLEELCPYGVPGDRLWVRETFLRGYSGCTMPCGEFEAHPTSDVQYCADGAEPGFLDKYQTTWMRKCPSTHMPRWASRILLEITHVDVEQVQDISESDAEAEGVRAISWYDLESIPESEIRKNTIPRQEHLSYRAGFYKVWTDIYGMESWDRNDWVWALKTKVLEVKK